MTLLQGRPVAGRRLHGGPEAEVTKWLVAGGTRLARRLNAAVRELVRGSLRDGHRNFRNRVSALLMDLCFLDDRDADAGRELSRLRSHGKRGVPGPFETMFASPHCQDEVASVYAEVFYRLGYLSVSNLVGGDRWHEMTAGLREQFEDRDMTQGEAVNLLGKPSLAIGRKVLCYAPADPVASWLFVDCHTEPARRYEVGRGCYTADRGTEPLVRSVRRSGQDFESGLILTLYGKTLRWGPGWWIDHPSQNQPAGAAAIAARLREIRAADPSQSPAGPEADHEDNTLR